MKRSLFNIINSHKTFKQRQMLFTTYLVVCGLSVTRRPPILAKATTVIEFPEKKKRHHVQTHWSKEFGVRMRKITLTLYIYFFSNMH